MLAGTSLLRLRPAWIAVATCIVLTAIFWDNLFRFYPSRIEPVYDPTTEALVVGRMARAAAEGYFNHTDLGANLDPKNPPTSAENYQRQVRYFLDPEQVHGLKWGAYPSHFALQGFLFAAIDAVNPMPRTMRIPFYHLLACLFMASALVWIAWLLRAKFGWAAFAGFLLAPAMEPMFTGLAPNLYWLTANWLLPIPFAILLADEDDERRRRIWLALAFLAFLMKFLSGYEFASTMILAAAVSCLLTVKERPDLFRHVLRNASWVVVAGVSAFIVAAIMHAAKEGGFTVFAQKAANRILGNSPSLEEALTFGKFQPIGAVLSQYLGGNLVTLIKSFGLVLALIAMYAILLLLDERFNWFYSAERRKLQVLALTTLASFAAPLSWFILAKAHSYDHVLYDLAMWYVPTIPFGFAMFGVAGVSIMQYLKLKRGDALLSLAIAAIPSVIVGTAGIIRLIDKNIETAGTWVITEHANAFPVFENLSLGIEFRMSNQWFTLLYPCSARPPNRTFAIKADQDGKTISYDFEEDKRLVLSSNGQCLAAQAKSDRPIARMHIGETSDVGPIWNRDVTLALPDSFSPASFSSADWDRGVSRGPATEVIVSSDYFGQFLIKKGDQVVISPTDRRTIVSIASLGTSKILMLDGPPIRIPLGQHPGFGIERK